MVEMIQFNYYLRILDDEEGRGGKGDEQNPK